jgi:hypothetical protein
MGHLFSCLLPKAPASHSTATNPTLESNKPSAQPLATQIAVNKVPDTDYTFSKLASQTLERVPGSLPPGYPISIENCTNSSLFILDFISQLSVDECSNCTLVLGPTEGSLFLRDCRDCTVICSAQQVRYTLFKCNFIMVD